MLATYAPALTNNALECVMADHIPTYISDDVKARFWAKVDVRGPDECWPWVSNVSGRGYGKLTIQGRTVMAHRLSVMIDGRGIPDGMVSDHICRNRLCVNPSHLRVVTVAVNNVENSTSPTALNKVKTHCPQGHEYTAENTRFLQRKEGVVSRMCRACDKIHTLNYYYRKRRVLKRNIHDRALENGHEA